MAAPLRIRLVKKNGDLIHLDCTNYTFNVQRGVTVLPVPFTGERVGVDMNQVQSDIRLECILRDDECDGIEETVTYAHGKILWDARADTLSDSGVNEVKNLLDGADGGSITIANLHNTTITFVSTDGTTFVLTLSSGGTDTVSGNNMTVGLDGLDGAVAVVAHIYTEIGNWTNFNSKFTTTKETGWSTEDAGLGFTQKVGGGEGQTSTPIVDMTNSTGAKNDVSMVGPVVVKFGWVRDSPCLSAGDKMQDIMGTVANNSVLGVLGGVGASKYGRADKGFGGTLNKQPEDSDYIIGLQLPFNSMAQASAGTDILEPVASFNTRNFILITGFGIKNKGASSNVERASETFSMDNPYTGISGTVKQADFTYNAGETTYSATLSFQPLDLMSGI